MNEFVAPEITVAEINLRDMILGNGQSPVPGVPE